jgi:predicted HTH domain antitoxin
MGKVQIELDEDFVEVLALLDQPVEQAARELMVMELYRRELISSGKAAQLLGMSKLDFIQYSGRLGIPYFRMTMGELREEVETIRRLQSER